MERTSKLDKIVKEEREQLITRLAKSQNGLCYVCSKAIDPQVHEVDIDHIIALTNLDWMMNPTGGWSSNW